MLRLGFDECWVKLIMGCVSAVSYSVLFEGDEYGHIVPFQGLRKGDPLSPYLFLFVVDGLSALLRH